jgi:crotonobetainyl-CoA:carnitine CoA-transferase CaiB-like acyl-CoA transferase
MSGPLHGYRIIELTSTVSGPVAGMIMGDQGADIIKIEPPMVGDLARHMGDIRNGVSAMYATLNRNKRSLVLDLKDAADMDIFLQLVPTADVLIENYRPGIVEKLGIDYETLKLLNPGLVYASISGYGESGPYRHRRVYDPLIQATTGTSSQQSGDKPANIRTVIFDKVTGYTTAQAITAALLARAKTGRGQRLSISMLCSALYFQWPDVMWSHTFEGEGVHSSGPLADWFQVFKTGDGFVAIILVTSDAFENLCKLLGLQLQLDDRFSSLPARLANMETLRQLLEETLTDWSTEDLCTELDAHDVPVARVNSLDEMLKDPQIVEQEAVCRVEHPVAGSMHFANTPFHFEGQGTLPALHAAQLGQHSAEILKELGCSQENIDRVEQREQKNREIMATFNLADAK